MTYVSKAKKRYTTRTGGFRVKRLIKDVQYIKSALNSERKHIIVQFGTVGSAFLSRQVVDKDNPVVKELLPLSNMVNGTLNGQRIGDNLKITSISYKGSVMLDNLNLKSQTTRTVLYLVMMKDSDNHLSIDEMFEKDQNGDYGPCSYWNEEHYDKYSVLAKHEINQRQNISESGGSAPSFRITNYFDNHIIFDENRRIMCKFDSSTGQLETNTLYFVAVTDSLLDSDTDKLQFDLNMKINYVDN